MASQPQPKRETYRVKRIFMGQLPMGTDLFEGISRICEEEDIKIGRVTALGAVSRAEVAFFDQKRKTYVPLRFNRHLEILNCTGNISMRNGQPFLHMHATFADRKGNVFGGHLNPGTIVFACELFIEELDGRFLERKLDEKSGLRLWGRDSNLI